MTIMEIAELAGVSSATVSRVLNNSSHVREDTRNRVLSLIREYDYVPNPAARNLVSQNTSHTIGLFIPDMDNPFFTSIMKGVTRIADKYNYNITLFNTDETPEREHRFLRSVREQNLRGVIMIPLSSHDEESEADLRKLEHCGVPVVLVDRWIGSGAFDSVFTDDMEDSCRAVEALIAGGHTRIATITGVLRSRPGEERLKGYEKAMRNHGLEIRPEYVAEGNFKFDRAYEMTQKLLSLREPPTAIFTANNFSTLAALQAILERGLTVGKNISLIGFDEIARWQWYPLLQHTGVELSLVERPVMQMAEEAMELLESRIEQGPEPDKARRKLLLSNQLVLRGSERMEFMG